MANTNIEKENKNQSLKIVNDLLNSKSLDSTKTLCQDLENRLKSFKNKLLAKREQFATTENVEVVEPVSNEATPVDTPKPIEDKKVDKKVEAKVEKPTEENATEIKEEVKAEKKGKKKEKVEEPAEIKEEKAEEKKEEKPVEAKKKETKAEVKEEAKTEAKPTEVKPVEVPKARPSFIVRKAEPVKKAEFIPTRNNDNRDRSQFNRGNGTGANGKPFNKDFHKDGKEGFNKKPGFQKKTQGGYVAPEILPTSDKRAFNGKKKQTSEKSYEEKHTISKRALIRESIDIDDFDENKTGYRKFRPVKKEKVKEEVNTVKIEKAVITTETIPLKVLSEKIGITAAEITKRLFKEGIMKTINDSLDFDTAAFIADEIGVKLELKLEKSAEAKLSEGFDTVEDDEKDLVLRPPVVTVMGHVDHGKTSLLDRIRKTNVTAGEAGGITQHIGAYQVTAGGHVITFLDTPGHAAFTAMRARGAQATDIAVLVVAADDGIMPQTEEAISHAKAAGVPIIVAINKIDKPEANIEKVKTELTEHELVPEEWGGDTIICPISAKAGTGIDNLLENINLVAEMKELKANPKRDAKGVVIEAKLDTSKGPIATILVQNGTLKVGDNVVIGTVTGKIRAMQDDKGRKVNSAPPSSAVSVMGLDEVPNAGDILYAVKEDKLLKMVAEERKNQIRESMIKASSKVSLDDVFNKINEGSIKGLNIVVKADVQGSVEALKSSLEKLSNEEVKVNVIHAQVGAIKESDIMLAQSSKAVIIGFNVRPDSNAKSIAEQSNVDIKLYRVIYEALEDVEKALKGMLAPKITETYLGKAEVREVFKISGVGQVAGAYVVDGKIIRSGKLRIYRDDIMICEGNVLQLKRFKDDVKEVAQGFECGISIEKFNDIKVGDFIECYEITENKA